MVERLPQCIHWGEPLLYPGQQGGHLLCHGKLKPHRVGAGQKRYCEGAQQKRGEQNIQNPTRLRECLDESGNDNRLIKPTEDDPLRNRGPGAQFDRILKTTGISI